MVRLHLSRMSGVAQERMRAYEFALAISCGDPEGADMIALESRDPDRVRLKGIAFLATGPDARVPLEDILQELNFGYLRYHPLYRRTFRVLAAYRQTLARKYAVPGAFGVPPAAPKKAVGTVSTRPVLARPSAPRPNQAVPAPLVAPPDQAVPAPLVAPPDQAVPVHRPAQFDQAVPAHRPVSVPLAPPMAPPGTVPTFARMRIFR